MIRERWELNRRQLQTEYESSPRTPGILKSISRRMEEVIGKIYQNTRESHPLSSNRFALLSTGGLGRRELHPYSDVDLVFLFEKPLLWEDEEFLKAMLAQLWDLGVTIGHHVLHLKEYVFDSRNLEKATALLDLRMLTGDAELADQFRLKEVQRFLSRQRKDFLKALLDFQEERYQRFNETIYQLEPDVKEAPGGLRDLHVSRWIAKLLYGVEGGQGLVDREVLTPSELRRLREAYQFLGALRTGLHFQNRRNRNILTHDLQEILAPRFGFSSSSGPEGVNVRALMKEYFLKAKEIHNFYESMRRRAFPPSRRISKSFKSTVWSTTRVRRGALEFTDPQVIRSQPVNLLKLFYRSAKYQIPISESALDQVKKNLSLVDAQVRALPEVRDLFLRLLQQPKGVYKVLVLMHETGLLGRLFPEFDRIRCQVIQDFFHRYTVDEHSLRTIKYLEELRQSRRPRDCRWGDLVKSLFRTDLLFFTMLFHDVGKAEEGNHVTKSLEALKVMAQRIHLTPEDFETVRFLIHSHLEMSNAFQRRDITDESMLRAFSEYVGNQENLKMLCLVTYADIKAVSPEALTPWKEDLLWQLYVETDAHLTRVFADDRWKTHQASEKIEALLPLVPEDPAGLQLRAFLDGFPRRYLQFTAPARIVEHFHLSGRLRSADEFVMKLSRRRSTYELSLMAFDRPFLFANLTGVLAYFGMNILRGQAFANHHGVILDIIEFEDHLQTFKLNRSEIDRFRETLRAVMLNQQSLAELLKRRENSNLFQPKSRGIVNTNVHFVEAVSGNYSILEIVAKDRLGLLSTIARTISEAGCNIEVALISTEGHKAIDNFYLTSLGGQLAGELQSHLCSMMKKSLDRLSAANPA